MASRSPRSMRCLARKAVVISTRRPDNLAFRAFHSSPHVLRSAEEEAEPQRSSSTSKKQYPHYPSVQHLLQTSRISPSDAAKIPTSGPHGRLLKGDVLAYLGTINANYPSRLSDRLTQLGHLDLSNIQPAPSTPAPPATAAIPATQTPRIEPESTEPITLPISLHAVHELQSRLARELGVHLPLATFVSRAADSANRHLPRGRDAPLTSAELFDAVVLGAQVVPRTRHGAFVARVEAGEEVAGSVGREKREEEEEDIYDLLSGGGRTIAAARSGLGGRRMERGKSAVPEKEKKGQQQQQQESAVFTVDVSRGDEMRARTFLERVKSVLEVEPGRLIL
ncbi:MAG: pyridoxine biosynthesis protein [Peltula sp. TS41687]|nr:MAG: pyridoxine biosynthesis protein [Peltula sp. TS41687]